MEDGQAGLDRSRCWLRLQAPPSVPGTLALDANSVTWAIDNGPGSTLGNYLYGLAESPGEDLADPCQQSYRLGRSARSPFNRAWTCELGC